MPETSRTGRRTPPPRFGDGRHQTSKRPAAVALIIGVVALCAAGVGFGAYAAIGDGAGPAAIGGHIGIKPSAPSGPDVVAEGEHHAGEVDGTPVTTPPTGSAPPAAPAPSMPPTTAPSPSPAPPPTSEPPALDPSDPMSPEYNPYLTPGDPAYVPEEERAAWLGRQELIRQCMREAGHEYLEWQWWEGGSPMPVGLDAAAETAWMAALRGAEPTDPAAGWEGAGCEGAAQHAAEEAAQAGSPVTAPLPMRDPAAPTERERWLAFQDAVRGCMTAQGYPYEYWEYWNPEDQRPGASAAMPNGLGPDERAAWNTAAFGSPDATGAEQPLDGGGCWTAGAEAVDYREFQ